MSWLIDDFLAGNAFFGAADGATKGAMRLSSVSRKTASGTAYAMKRRGGVEVVGLTSLSNVAFCNRLGGYDRVLSYQQLDQIAADAPCIYVDFAGITDWRFAVHTRFCQSSTPLRDWWYARRSAWQRQKPARSASDTFRCTGTNHETPHRLGCPGFRPAAGNGMARFHRPRRRRACFYRWACVCSRACAAIIMVSAPACLI